MLNANQSKNTGGGGGSSAPVLEPATYPARLVVVADLGLQPQRPWQGKEKPPAYEILTTYELVDEFMQDEDGNELTDKPRWLSETFPLYSLSSERAKSTVRYNALDPNGTIGGEWAHLITIPCLVTTVNNPGKGKNADKTYTNIANVAGMRAKDRENVPELVNKSVVFDLDDPCIAEFDQLPQWVQDKIKAGLEYPGSELHDRLKVAAKVAKDVEASLSEDLDDEIPF